MIIAQGKRGTSAALGYGRKINPSPFSWFAAGPARRGKPGKRGGWVSGGGLLPRAAASAALPWAIIALPLRGADLSPVASFPRNLTIPQLLRSNVWAIVPLVMRGPTTAFTHRGLSPHQFTPMSGAHHWVQATPGCAFCLFLSQWPGAPDPAR